MLSCLFFFFFFFCLLLIRRYALHHSFALSRLDFPRFFFAIYQYFDATPCLADAAYFITPLPARTSF